MIDITVTTGMYEGSIVHVFTIFMCLQAFTVDRHAFRYDGVLIVRCSLCDDNKIVLGKFSI